MLSYSAPVSMVEDDDHDLLKFEISPSQSEPIGALSLSVTVKDSAGTYVTQFDFVVTITDGSDAKSCDHKQETSVLGSASTLDVTDSIIPCEPTIVSI